MKLSIEILKSLLKNPSLDYKKENIRSECPYCGFNEFGISVKENHLWGCFRQSKCGEKGNVFKLLKHLGRTDLFVSNKVIKIDQLLESELEVKKDDGEVLELKVPTISAPPGWKRVYSNEYLNNRGFKAYEKYKVGITSLIRKYEDYIILLVEEGGEIKAYVSRATVDCDKRYRYRNSVSDFSKLLLGYDEIIEDVTKTVILVEGFFDKDNVDRLLELDDQDEIKCCATFGAKISREQIFKLHLKGVDNIIILFDPDVINKIKRYAIELMQEFKEVQVGYVGSKKDVGEVNFIELGHILDGLISPINFNFSKVQIFNLE